MAGTLRRARPGAPRKITDEQVERAVTTTLEDAPPHATHWSTRSLAAATGLSQSAVVRIWRAFALRPHRVATFKPSQDPLSVEKVRDIVGLHLAPPDRALVPCVDEKPQIRAVERTAPVLPMRPGQPERLRTHKAPPIQRWLAKRPRYHLHFTPTSASWHLGQCPKSGRGLVRPAHPAPDPARGVPHRRGPGGGDPPLHRGHQRRSAPVRLDQEC